MLHLPKTENSYWRESCGKSVYAPLSANIRVDVAVVGAGITGLTAAYLLKQAGLTVAVLEKRTVGSGTTGRTTGKVTSQHNLVYADMVKRHGQKVARIYGEANQAAAAKIRSIINKEKISCEWQIQDNYVYTTLGLSVELFKEEARAAAELGLPASFERDSPLPFEIKAAVKFSGQGQMHAQKYLMGLAHTIHGDGSFVFENSSVAGIRDGSLGRVKTKQGVVRAKHIIVATNVPTLPLMARGGYCLSEYPIESYIVAGWLSKDFDGMYISPDKDNYSLLPVAAAGRKLLLIGGRGNISGLRGSKYARYRHLAEYAAKRFGITSFEYCWSDRDYLSYDGMPLVGKLYPWSRNLYTGTAFKKWGLTNGTAAAMILADTVRGKKNPWSSTFNSNRLSPMLSIPRVAARYSKHPFSA